MYENEKNCPVDLESKQYVKYLGPLVDSSLTWKNHIDQIALKICKTIGLLAKLKQFDFDSAIRIVRHDGLGTGK